MSLLMTSSLEELLVERLNTNIHAHCCGHTAVAPLGDRFRTINTANLDPVQFKTEEVGVRGGMSMTLVALGAIAGPPISGAINGATGGFVFTGVYAGAQKSSSLSPLLPSPPL